MIPSKNLVSYRQRALEERLRPSKVALVMKEIGEVIEARRRIGMLGAERLLVDRQCTLGERPRRIKIALVLK